MDNQSLEQMSDRGTIVSNIRSFILKKFPAAKKRSIGDDTPLLESGIIDSLGMLDVVAFLEHSFSITVADDDLVPDNFADIYRMVSFVETKQREKQIPAR